MALIQTRAIAIPVAWGTGQAAGAGGLRQKLTRLSQNHAPEQWAGRLSRDWLQASGEWAGTLYVDGHVRAATCEAPPATGSTTRWASPSSWSNQGCWIRLGLKAPKPNSPDPDRYSLRSGPYSLIESMPSHELPQVSERRLARAVVPADRGDAARFGDQRTHSAYEALQDAAGLFTVGPGKNDPTRDLLSTRRDSWDQPP